jgi:hypothetical protein
MAILFTSPILTRSEGRALAWVYEFTTEASTLQRDSAEIAL